MKTIDSKKISSTVKNLCLKANIELRSDVLSLLKDSCGKESDPKARGILKAILDNARIARKEKLAICQDTGLPCVFVELGQDLKIKGDLNNAINKGVDEGYKSGSFRNSVIKDPLGRGKSGNAPAIIHIDLVKGRKFKITVLPKGFGCENKSQLKMFNPTASWPQISEFIVNAVKTAGPDACPPYVVGVGIGGSADYACLLAKKALLRNINSKNSKLEDSLLKEINKLNIGPMGLGGKATALAVKIEEYPTHIAGLPVAVNISCHATRSATAVI
jgi:fumarate hydratase subunit alpha